MAEPETTANTSRDDEMTITTITPISNYPILCAHERPVPAPLRKQCNDEKDHEAGFEATDTQRNEFISATSSQGDEGDCSTTIKQRETVAKTEQNRKAKGSDEATCSIPEVRWESSPCVHMDRNYWPRAYYGETNLHLVKEMLVTESEGDNFHFAHCGHLYLCDCYSILDAIEEALIVASDAGVRRKDEPNSVTGIGVFVGPGSPFNASEVAVPCPDSMAAELSAALRALQTVKQMKERGRIPLVSEVILKTDNESMEGAMTGTIFRWRRAGFLDDSGRAIKYRDLYWVLEEAVVELYNSHHTAVLFFWTPRRYNIDADRLATAALRQEDLRLGIFVAKPIKSQQRKRKCDEDEQANLMNAKRLCAQIAPAPRRDSATTLVPSSDAHKERSPPGLPDHLSGIATQHTPKFIGPLRPSLAELGKSAPPGYLSSIAMQITPKFIGPVRPLFAELDRSAPGGPDSQLQLPYSPPSAKTYQSNQPRQQPTRQRSVSPLDGPSFGAVNPSSVETASSFSPVLPASLVRYPEFEKPKQELITTTALGCRLCGSFFERSRLHGFLGSAERVSKSSIPAILELPVESGPLKRRCLSEPPFSRSHDSVSVAPQPASALNDITVAHPLDPVSSDKCDTKDAHYVNHAQAEGSLSKCQRLNGTSEQCQHITHPAPPSAPRFCLASSSPPLRERPPVTKLGPRHLTPTFGVPAAPASFAKVLPAYHASYNKGTHPGVAISTTFSTRDR
ncbi:hypothetical protein LTR74_004631 [Friedmanniomyces endolithicus]|nr:hypothetical protein LTR74_004631 [Friedmanniomyces endolithicus]